jgi:hypothetical protein
MNPRLFCFTKVTSAQLLALVPSGQCLGFVLSAGGLGGGFPLCRYLRIPAPSRLGEPLQSLGTRRVQAVQGNSAYVIEDVTF